MRYLALASVLFLASCGGSSSSDDAGAGGSGGGTTGLSIDPDPGTMELGDLVALTALDQSLSAVSASWTSSDPAVLTLSASLGTSIIVTAVAEGTASVQAAVGGLQASVSITVVACDMPTDASKYFRPVFSHSLRSRPMPIRTRFWTQG